MNSSIYGAIDYIVKRYHMQTDEYYNYYKLIIGMLFISLIFVIYLYIAKCKNYSDQLESKTEKIIKDYIDSKLSIQNPKWTNQIRNRKLYH